jgi:hypothetical protein
MPDPLDRAYRTKATLKEFGLASFIKTEHVGKDAAAAFSNTCSMVPGFAGGASALIRTGVALKKGYDLHRIGDRWSKLYESCKTEMDKVLAKKQVLFQFEKCMRRIKRREYRTVTDGGSSVGGIGSSTISLAVMFGVTVGSVTSIVGLVLILGGIAAGTGIAGYKYYKRRTKSSDKTWKKINEYIAEYNLPLAPPWCITTGDYYRHVVALFIYEASLDLLPDAHANYLGKQMAWVLFGGNDLDAAAAEAIRMGVGGITGFIKG